MSDKPLRVLRGTVDMLVLRALADAPRHGYGVVAWVLERTSGRIELEEGALYAALHRMEEKRWVRSRWGMSENKRRAKFYRLTAAGTKQLVRARRHWSQYAAAVHDLMILSGD